MNVSRRLVTRAVATALALGIAGPSFASACQDVTFTVTNEHYTAKSIKIKKIKYRDVTANKSGIVEDVVDITCSAHASCTTLGDDLGDLVTPRLGHDLSNIQFQYQYKEADGDWSTPVWSKKFMPTDKECRNDRNYGTADWVITG